MGIYGDSVAKRKRACSPSVGGDHGVDSVEEAAQYACRCESVIEIPPGVGRQQADFEQSVVGVVEFISRDDQVIIADSEFCGATPGLVRTLAAASTAIDRSPAYGLR